MCDKCGLQFGCICEVATKTVVSTGDTKALHESLLDLAKQAEAQVRGEFRRDITRIMEDLRGSDMQALIDAMVEYTFTQVDAATAVLSNASFNNEVMAAALALKK